MAALMLATLALFGQHVDRATADHFACHEPNRGWGFDTHEYEDYVAGYNQAIDLAVRGLGTPAPYQLASGETIDVSFQGLESGPREARQPASKAAAVPTSLYKSIVWIESGWSHAAPSVPYGGVGSVIISIDCGYGLGQITSGMGHLSAPPALDVRVPSARQAVIGTHSSFNLAEGVRILADKWNSAPGLRPVSGAGDPAALEDWYYATWSYNGFAFSNHPLNPNRDALRGALWNCSDPSAPGAGVFNYGDYTYPEKVYGCLRYPPVPPGTSYPPPLGGGPATAPTAISVGDTVVVVGTGTCLNIRPQPAGEPPITCVPDGTQATIAGGPATAAGLEWWQVTVDGVTGWAAADFLVKPTAPVPDAPVNPVGRMWAPQVFAMPVMSAPAVAAAFALDAFEACQEGGASDACAGMDYPTTIPELGVTTHQDSGMSGLPGNQWALIGDPQMQVLGSRTVNLSVTGSSATASTVTVRNTGTMVAPFRVRTSAAWLIVRHPGDPPGRVVDGGVAVGPDVEVVIQKSPRTVQQGKDSVLEITVDPTYMPDEPFSGTVIIDALLGSGDPVTITVSGTRTGAGAGGGGQGQAPQFRSILPNLTSDGSR